MPRRQFPFPAYPNGWFVVQWSDELAAGDVKPLTYFGRELVLFRDDDGAAHVLDAHCRHRGAHLGHGGTVEGCSIRCPFHGWRWEGATGACDEVPGSDEVPADARLAAWPVCEENGLIFVWHHAEGASPDYEIPKLREVSAHDGGPFTKLEWRVHSRMYDMGENAVDHVHFKYLHGASGSPTNEQRQSSDGTQSTFSKMKMTTPRGPVDGSIETKGYGPGLGVVCVKGVVETLILTTNTPIDSENVHVRFSYLQEATDDEHQQRVGRAMLRDLKRQMEQDIVVFEHKKYWTRPLLVPEDGPIMRYRKNSRRFYTGDFYRLDE